jgi:hypothetical protein
MIRISFHTSACQMDTHADETVTGLELLLALLVVVDQAEALGDTTAELGAETKDDDTLLLGLVKLREALAELSAREVGAGGVGDVKNELLAVKQAVRNELRSAKGDGAVGVLLKMLAMRSAFMRAIPGDDGKTIRQNGDYDGVAHIPRRRRRRRLWVRSLSSSFSKNDSNSPSDGQDFRPSVQSLHVVQHRLLPLLTNFNPSPTTATTTAICLDLDLARAVVSFRFCLVCRPPRGR